MCLQEVLFKSSWTLASERDVCLMDAFFFLSYLDAISFCLLRNFNCASYDIAVVTVSKSECPLTTCFDQVLRHDQPGSLALLSGLDNLFSGSVIPVQVQT